MLRDKDVKKSERVMKAILQMTKPDIKTLKQAYEQPQSSTADGRLCLSHSRVKRGASVVDFFNVLSERSKV